MKKIIITLFCSIVVFLFSNSQAKTGIVYFGEIQSLGMGSPVGHDYNAILLFDNNRSLYVTRMDSLEERRIDGQLRVNSSKEKRSITSVSTNEEGFQYYNDFKKDKFLSRDLGFKYVKETLPIIEWNILDDKKKIGDFECQKAVAKFRGRFYTAWFSTSIPLPFGPWKLQGLPGLILEAYDTDREIYWYFKEIHYPSDFATLLKPILNSNDSWMSFLDYKTFLIESYERAIAGGRIATEKIGIKSYENSMHDNYIEAFEIKND